MKWIGQGFPTSGYNNSQKGGGRRICPLQMVLYAMGIYSAYAHFLSVHPAVEQDSWEAGKRRRKLWSMSDAFLKALEITFKSF